MKEIKAPTRHRPVIYIINRNKKYCTYKILYCIL